MNIKVNGVDRFNRRVRTPKTLTSSMPGLFLQNQPQGAQKIVPERYTGWQRHGREVAVGRREDVAQVVEPLPQAVARAQVEADVSGKADGYGLRA